MPDTRVRAFTVCDADGDYNIYINANISAAMQRRAYRHEMRHIRRGDFDGGDVNRIEQEAHDGTTA